MLLPIAAFLAAPSGEHAVPALIGLLFASGTFYLFGVRPLRARTIEVRLHAGGIEIVRPTERTRVAFDDVDEVYLTLSKQRNDDGEYAAIDAIHLVRHDRRRFSIPAQLERADALFRAVLEACSLSLVPAAVAALERGDELTFGSVTLDGASLRIGDARVAWTDIDLVRFGATSMTFFKTGAMRPWRRISLAAVPHPSVLLHLVTLKARRIQAHHLAFPPGRTGVR